MCDLGLGSMLKVRELILVGRIQVRQWLVKGLSLSLSMKFKSFAMKDASQVLGD
jgi:hypothetical protein